MKSEKTNEELLNSEYGREFIQKLLNYKGGENVMSLFNSIEDVFIFIAYAEENYPPDLVKGLKISFGLGEPYGIMVEVEGIGEIDVSIAEIVKELNDTGFKTLASCSGLIKDHPALEGSEVSGYISFEDNDKQSIFVKSICDELDLEFEKSLTYFKPSYVVRIKAPNDEVGELKWKEFKERLLGNG